MKIAFYTLGCKVNQYETQALEQLVTQRGHSLVPFEEAADAYVINTCTVTAVSDKKSRQVIRRARKAAPDAVIAVCGCYPQTHPDDVEKLGVDLISGTGDRTGFVDLLEREGAEAIVPDLMDFLNYCVYNSGYKHEFLGGTWRSAKIGELAVKAIAKIRQPAIQALQASRRFDPPLPISQVADYAKPFLSVGNQYGEGWFLTGEMVELIHTGAPNVVCIQPFACLPNHVVGKGVIKLLRKTFPQANIVAVDYDPGASEVNQLNRIKLMLATARKNLSASAPPTQATTLGESRVPL